MKAEYNKASEEILYINTDFNLLQFETICRSSLKVGRNPCENPKMVLFAHDP